MDMQQVIVKFEHKLKLPLISQRKFQQLLKIKINGIGVQKENKIMKENKNIEEYKFARPLSEATLRNLKGYVRYCIGCSTFVTKK